MPWLKHRLRDADVWAKVDDAGALVTDRDGRVEIVYKPADGAKVYRAGARNLAAVPDGKPVDIVAGEPAPEKPKPEPKAEAKTATPATPAKLARGKTPPKPAGAGLNPDKVPHGAVEIWCDGACSGNPGPSGLGAVIIDGEKRVELSEFLGPGTNITAEMTAIIRALEQVADHDRIVVVHTDSQFSIDMLTKNPPWKPKKNIELVARLRAIAKSFPNLKLVWVRGHADVELNERCDELATAAVARGY
jgi:ribonuclease HI